MLYPILPFFIILPLSFQLLDLDWGRVMGVKHEGILVQVFILAEFKAVCSNSHKIRNINKVIWRDL